MLLYVCQDGEQPSGVATYGYSMLRHLPDARMLLLNAAGPPVTAPADLHHRITTIPRESSHDPALVAKAIDAIAAKHSDGLTLLPNTGDTPWAAAAGWLRDAPPAARLRCRILGIVHSDMETQYAIADHYAAVAPVWIGVSHRCANELRRRFSSRSAEVHELPYPVETSPTLPARDNTGPLRLAYVGRLEEPQKRISRLVPLFEALAARGIDFRATVAGDGPAAADLADAVRTAAPAVRPRVHLTGAVSPDSVGAIWRSHDIGILVSDFEGLPLALLEAMAAGVCPVVMRVESGVDEILADGENARVVARGETGAMAAAIAELCDDRDQLRRLQRAAWDTSARYAPKAHFAELRRLLARCWSLAPPAASAVAPDDTST
ncbi:MAG: glycosyltransferase family 4 protein, partial [Vicinamibacterales bacterium]